MSLVGVQREVPFGETVLEQAQQIVDHAARRGPAAARLGDTAGHEAAGALHDRAGGRVRRSEPDVRTRHTGGALDELFTVYTIVNALTTNLPAVKRVQILIEGKEVDTLAGHVDLRHPLQKNLKWVRTEKGDT